MNWNIPNSLTYLRILLIPVFVGIFYMPADVIDPHWVNFTATLIFALAAITDWFDGYLARALNQNNIEVLIPQQYLDDPVDFVAQVLGLEIPLPPTGARVVVNARAGCIVLGEDVEITPAVVTHKNILVEAAPVQAPANRFVPVDPGQSQSAKLKGLVEALNALHVPPADMVQILQNLDRGGHIQGQLIIE